LKDEIRMTGNPQKQSGLILALDSGGTKCQAMLFDETGKIIGMGVGQGPEISGRSPRAVQMAIEMVTRGLPAIESLIIVHNLRLPCLRKLSFSNKKLFSVAEHTSSLALVGETCGIVVLSGTGSFVYGQNRAGRELSLDGFGPVLGDSGGGYSIGLHALRAAAKSDWHTRYQTSLRRRVFEYCGVENITDLIEFSLKAHDRSVIAGLAKIVDDEAKNGDAVAISILRSAADDIADILRTVLEILKMEQEQYKMIGTGSVVKSDIYWDHLCQKARVFAPALEPVRPALPQVMGVAFAGLRHFQPEHYGMISTKLTEQYAEYIKKGKLE